MPKFPLILLVILLVIIIGLVVYKNQPVSKLVSSNLKQAATTVVTNSNPLSIEAMRAKSYPGSDIKIEQTLADGDNYHQYIASYKSDGLKINGLLTVPIGTAPTGGWPVILFNHGFIPPQTYQTDPSVGQYASYLPVFARAGYVVFKSDYRGHDNSQGQPESAYYSPAYAIDVLNALSSIKKYPGVNPSKIGFWGHSMGGNITLRSLVVRPDDIKVAVIWGGVIGSYDDLINNWQRRVRYIPPSPELANRNNGRQMLLQQYGQPKDNPGFWNTIDPTAYISDIKAPIQLNVGGADEEVPPDFSSKLRDKLQAAGKTVEYYEYPGDNHNIAGSFNEAMQHSLQFLDKYLK